MKILYAASEAAPFVKTGGLGDVAYALPQALSQIEDVEICVFLPYYRAVKNNPACPVEFVTHFEMPLAWRNAYVGIFRAAVGRVTYYFVDNEYYFGRDGLYGHYDDGERFAYFSKAVLEALRRIQFYPDIIEANDWQTALIPLYLKAFFSAAPEYSQIKTVFTIHNIEYQGKLPNEFLTEVAGVSEDWRPVMTYGECVNLMKGAIVLCDKISTVSETYSHEIRHAYFSHGLHDILRENEYKIHGILNGIDQEVYNPQTDPNLAVNYGSGEPKKKAENKRMLQRQLGLAEAPDIPLVAMISRLVEHKGLELVEYVCQELAGLDIQLVVVGTGDWKYEELFRSLAAAHPGKISASIAFDPALASQVYAGADLFLMPSKSEPCGLSQMIAMRYGALPIVRETGGLVDTVQPVNTETLEGRGFTFKTFNAGDMLDAVKRAAAFYRDRESFLTVSRRVMETDFGWSRSAQQYDTMFRQLI